MSATFNARLPFDDEETETVRSVGLQADRDRRLQPDPDLPDAEARFASVDPTRNVVLEASAGTGKTRVLVERYVNLLRAGVSPDRILAITFTRKAAAEMRQRIIDRLRPSTSSGRPEPVEGRDATRLSELDRATWRELKDRLDDITISTIDAFCLSLLREFPLEADVDPGFDLADDTQIPRLTAESLDAAFRICRGLARDDEDVSLLFAQLGERRLRAGIAALLDRRLAAPQALRQFLARGPKDLTAAVACQHAAARLRDVFTSIRAPGGFAAFLDDGPMHHPQFAMLAADIRALIGEAARRSSLDISASGGGKGCATASFRNFVDRLRAYFLKQDGDPRGRNFAGTIFKPADCHTDDAWKRHRHTAAAIAPAIADAIRGFRRDLNVVMSRGVWRVFAVALAQYERTLAAHALLDFSGVLERAVRLLRELDEFAETRLRLEARHQHILVDEFQDTSRAQWELVRQLVRSWGEGFGVGDEAIPPSIFIVGDRKQSIYGFRDADVALVDEAAAFVGGLRPDCRPLQAITVSFRSAPGILAFVNDLFGAIVAAEPSQRRDAFRYEERDRFPTVRLKPDTTTDTLRLQPDTTIDTDATIETVTTAETPLGLIVGDTVRETADRVADEIVTLLSGSVVRDRSTGIRRPARPADIAILFRSRDSHREFEAALARRQIGTYVYKGLGFFDADEVQDAVALLRYLADPLSNLRAAAFLRSRIVRLSDAAVARLGPQLAHAILGAGVDLSALGDEDRRVLELVRRAVPGWLSRVDRQTPSELLDALLHETAYANELRGSRQVQAHENLKKLRAMIRRAQNRGYATLARIADHLDQLAVGDESNAAIDAVDSVSLMTVHAAKGLEFPIVFVVHLGRGTGGVRPGVRVATQTTGEPSVSIADFQSEADEDAPARDREETKRLLYVALTRARDRLYLSAVLKDGKCRPGPGSLGQVLPDAIKQLFAGTAHPENLPNPVDRGSREIVEWKGPSGTTHRFAARR